MEIPVLDEPRFLSTNPIPTRGILMASSASTNDARAPCMCHLLLNSNTFQLPNGVAAAVTYTEKSVNPRTLMQQML